MKREYHTLKFTRSLKIYNQIQMSAGWRLDFFIISNGRSSVPPSRFTQIGLDCWISETNSGNYRFCLTQKGNSWTLPPKINLPASLSVSVCTPSLIGLPNLLEPSLWGNLSVHWLVCLNASRAWEITKFKRPPVSWASAVVPPLPINRYRGNLAYLLPEARPAHWSVRYVWFTQQVFTKKRTRPYTRH